MRIIHLTPACVAAALLVLSPVFRDARASDFKYSLSGVLYEQPTYRFINDDNLLNPDNEVLDFPEWTNNLYGKINFGVGNSTVRFTSQFRPSLIMKQGDDAEFDFITDDAYVDVKFMEKNFFFAGKKNIRDGVGFGANPTDFLGEGKEVDYSKREEERRVEREGNYLVGGDVYLKNVSFTALYAPRIEDWQDEEDRALLKGNMFVESLNTDVSLHLFNGEIPGVGLNISGSIGDHLVLYTESALRWGSHKRTIEVVDPGDATTPRTFSMTDPEDDDTTYTNAVVGGSYTFGDGTNLVAEYIYYGQGYDSGEWEKFVDYVNYNNQAYLDDVFRESASGNLASASSIMSYRNMRQNYFFMRLSNSTLIRSIDAQLAFHYNIDDSSFLVNPSVDFKVASNLVAGISATFFSGEKDSEFGLMGWRTDTTLIIKYFF